MTFDSLRSSNGTAPEVILVATGVGRNERKSKPLGMELMKYLTIAIGSCLEWPIISFQDGELLGTSESKKKHGMVEVQALEGH